MSLQVFESVPSTMDIARQAVLSGALRLDTPGTPRALGVMAYEQTEGRGQRGRTWFAPKGESLCATYYFRRGLTAPERAGQIALLAGVAVAETLHRTVSACSLPVREADDPSAVSSLPIHPTVGLKWPNDVLLNRKKVGGILIEMVKTPDGEWVALIGVGINVNVRNLPPDIAPCATSLRLEGVPDCDVSDLGKQIGRALHVQADIRRHAGFEAILQRWRHYDQTTGRQYETEIEGVTVQGIAEGIAEDGALLLRLENGEQFAVRSASSLRETSSLR